MTKETNLPDDIGALKTLLTAQRVHNKKLQIENTRLQEQLNLAIARRYAASNEKISPDQFRLFDEAETEIPESDGEVNEPAGTTVIAEHMRNKKTGRKPLPKNLVRVDEIHKLDEQDRVCEHDGKRLNEIGDVISEQLDIIPAKIQVIRYI